MGGLDTLSPWPIFSGCLTNRGLSRYAGAASVTTRWEMDFTCWPSYAESASPTIGRDGTIYLAAGCDSSIVGLHPDGTFAFWGPYSYRPPTIARDGTLWIGSRDGLFHLAASGAALEWNGEVYGEDHSQPYVVGPGSVTLLGEVRDGAGFFSHRSVIQFGTGVTVRTAWNLPERGAADEGIAVGRDGTLFSCSSEGILAALGADGDLRWTVSLKGCLVPTIGPDRTIYVGYGAGLSAVSPLGEVLWSVPLGSDAPRIRFISIAPDGTLVASAQNDNTLYVLSPRGELLWTYTAGVYFGDGAAVIDRDGTIFAGFADGLRSLKLDGSVAWFHPDAEGCTTPVIGADGTIYARCGTRLVALAPSTK